MIEDFVGRYLRLDIEGRPHRVYFEEAGASIPLICLHTAGSDTRQWRGLLTDPEITSRFRCIAFDRPWHGESSPPKGCWRDEYRLTTAIYVAMIRAVSDALGLDRPAVMGCSIGERIVLDLAAQHADAVRAVIGLQSSAHVDRYYDTSWTHKPDVHGVEVCADIVAGMMAPQSPADERWETLWHHMQGGPGVFRGDLHFYKGEGDLHGELGLIDTAECPVWLLTGDDDHSHSAGPYLLRGHHRLARQSARDGIGRHDLRCDADVGLPEFVRRPAAEPGADRRVAGAFHRPAWRWNAGGAGVGHGAALRPLQPDRRAAPQHFQLAFGLLIMVLVLFFPQRLAALPRLWRREAVSRG